MRNLGGHLAAAIAGVIVGAVLVLGVDGLTHPAPPRTGGPIRPEAPPPPRPVPVTGRPEGILLAWAPGGLPAGIEEAVRSIPGVGPATLVQAGLDWIESSRRPDGTRVDSPPKGMGIPWEVAVVRPREYARFVPPSEREAILSLRPGEALLAETSAGLRGSGAGLEIKLVDRRVRVTGVVSDVAANGYEALLGGAVPDSWERVDEFLLVYNRNAKRARIEREIRARLAPGQRVQVRVNDEQPFLRYGDAVHPQMIVKKEFGEFAARPLADGRLDIDDKWEKANIRSARVPLIGEVTCHRALFLQLRRALRRVAEAGLGHLVTSYAGCYSPRFIGRIPTGRISHHAWGIALDINHAENPFGAEPNQSQRVVELIEQWGFTWGGRWIIPDGMHFEWQAWP